ncbi:hypothetical protein MVEN_01686200 [Mycena venus]|uniref:Uncharacterized protein n=1 Tax=Mycena venus TaxID=2733690 RepID=A0A8H6XPF8_9AGAR|nr:hypothetical protein MVEN_01686200 [Mycena venus]
MALRLAKMPTRYLHICLFYLLITVATGAHAVLKNTNARFRNHGEERRRSVASIFPIILAKTLLFALAFPIIRTIVLAHQSWESTLVSRAHLCAHVLMVAYLFDMTYRKVNAILWAHHTLTLLACLFFLFSTSPDEPDAARLWLSAPMVFLGVGVGLTDLGGDVAVLLYYLAPQFLASSRAIRICARYLMVGRASAWSLVLAFLGRGEWRQLGLGPASLAIMCAVMLGWCAAEVEEIYAILGMSEKMRMRVLAEAESPGEKS